VGLALFHISLYHYYFHKALCDECFVVRECSAFDWLMLVEERCYIHGRKTNLGIDLVSSRLRIVEGLVIYIAGE
jgi:hypothetical protein